MNSSNCEGFWGQAATPGDQCLAVPGCVGTVSVQLGAGHWASVASPGGVDVSSLGYPAVGVWDECRVYHREGNILIS